MEPGPVNESLPYDGPDWSKLRDEEHPDRRRPTIRQTTRAILGMNRFPGSPGMDKQAVERQVGSDGMAITQRRQQI
jgi:hypothetical protein